MATDYVFDFLNYLVCRGFLPQQEEWSRSTGIILREEAARFVLSSFGLSIPAGSDALAPEADLERSLAQRLAKVRCTG